MNSVRFAMVGFVAALWVCAPAAAQTGNLVPNGRFDVGVSGWVVLNPSYNALVFDATLDFDDCTQSGVAHGICDPTVDYGVGQYVVCLGAVATAESYKISGEFLFLSSAVSGRAYMNISFFDGPDCTGAHTNGVASGYALSDVVGWQHVDGGPVTPDPTTLSASLTVRLVQFVGADPAIEVRFDEIRVTRTEWVFAEDLEIGEPCRWTQVVP